jgi:hypothetical protein
MLPIFGLLGSQHSRIVVLALPYIPLFVPMAIAVNHGDCLEINHKLLPSIAMSRCTILNFQVSRTNKNIATRQ